MVKKLLLKASSVFACSFFLTFTACQNFVEQNQITNAVEYGSIILNGENSKSADGTDRALDYSTITSADVTVSGYGMKDIVVKNVAITDGHGGTTIENIPTGPNRVVTVESNVTGATIRAVCDVNSGENPVNVNWSTTAVGSVFYNLIKKGTDVSEIAKTAFNSAIDGTVHASLIDAATIASDYPSLKSAASYVSDYGTVSVTTSAAAGYSVQITDIASVKKTIRGADDSFELKAYPGKWKAWVLDSTGTKVAEKDITVVAGETSTVDVKYSAGVDITDKIIVYSAKSLGYLNMYVWGTSNSSIEKKHIAMELNGDDYVGEIPATSCSIILTKKLNAWDSQTGNLAIASAGAWRFNGSSFSEEEVFSEPGITLTVNSATPPAESVKIYVSSTSGVPTLWVHDAGGHAISENMGEVWPGNAMSAANDLNNNEGWYVKEIDGEYISGSTLNIHINSGSVINTSRTSTFWYDAAGICGAVGTYYDSDPTTVPEPVLPTLTITPASGKEIGTASSIKITANFGYDTPSVKRVTINGENFTLTEGVNSYSVSDFTTEAGVTITVNATLTNSVGTATVNATYTTKIVKEDPFTWDNVNAYFVLTDRFANGDTTNDHSYYRKNGLSGDENVATFHGGDIKGLTDNLDYFDKLGVNAIWISAPYEQAHGWVSGKMHKFPHYAFHGYYTLDWTAMDANMGTVEELRTFVNACHSKGIRVIMDIVMNHVGYNNTEDMITYNHGKTDITQHGWLEKTSTCTDVNQGKCAGHPCWYANHTVQWDNDYWVPSWWGAWIRSWSYDDKNLYGGDCGGLPDIRSEVTQSVGMAPVLVTKWNTDSSSVKDAYYNPSVEHADWNGYSGNYRTDKGIAPADYQVVWLSAWVREVGIDGFRCDTAKHVEPKRWGELKVACQAALEAWRNDTEKSKLYNGVDTGAADWDENFWMTGECWGWKDIGATGGDYYGTGKFDSMINFSFNGDNNWDGNYRTNYPSSTNWSSYLSINSKADTDGNGNRDNVLTYISSHDTGLTRVGDQYEVGTGLVLLPGGVQIYYGDESYREKAYTGCGDGDMYTRGDMNLEEAKSSALVAHWGKVGRFRKYNPAVGAGTGSATKRSYSGPAGESKVAIGIDGTIVDVSGLWSDGTKVYNWYDGTSATVSGGKVSFTGGTMKTPILVSEKNPAKYGVTF